MFGRRSLLRSRSKLQGAGSRRISGIVVVSWRAPFCWCPCNGARLKRCGGVRRSGNTVGRGSAVDESEAEFIFTKVGQGSCSPSRPALLSVCHKRECRSIDFFKKLFTALVGLVVI